MTREKERGPLEGAVWAWQAHEDLMEKRRRDALALRALAECIEEGKAAPTVKVVLA